MIGKAARPGDLNPRDALRARAVPPQQRRAAPRRGQHRGPEAWGRSLPAAPGGTAPPARAAHGRRRPPAPLAMDRSARYLYPQAGSRARRSCARSSPSVGSAPCTSRAAVRFCRRTRSFMAAAAGPGEVSVPTSRPERAPPSGGGAEGGGGARAQRLPGRAVVLVVTAPPQTGPAFGARDTPPIAVSACRAVARPRSMIGRSAVGGEELLTHTPSLAGPEPPLLPV